MCLLERGLKNPTYLLLVQITHLYLIYPKKVKNVILVSSMHFDDTVNLDLQSLTEQNITNKKSGVDTMDQMIGTHHVARRPEGGLWL